MKIYIKNMVCLCCKTAVRSELEKINIRYKTIDLGEVETDEEVSEDKLEMLRKNLQIQGLELIKSKKEILAEKIASAIFELFQSSDESMKFKLSVYLSEKLNYDYHYLANIFSEVKGITIEKFYITNKIERVKELLKYDEFNLNEISVLTQYSSISHLSNQFKKATGLAPSHYKQLYARSHFQALPVNCQ
jgi:AraC-like DNA-binding protein